jgi:hypothetical protein
MSKYVPDTRIDLETDVLETTNIHVCSDQPVTYGDIAGFMLAEQVISGSFAKADGATGRKTTCPAQTGVTISNTGTATHVALSNGSDTLMAVTTSTSQALTQGGTLDIPAWAMTVGDPV